MVSNLTPLYFLCNVRQISSFFSVAVRLSSLPYPIHKPSCEAEMRTQIHSFGISSACTIYQVLYHTLGYIYEEDKQSHASRGTGISVGKTDEMRK